MTINAVQLRIAIAKGDLRRWWNRKVDLWAGCFMDWLFSQPSVQKSIISNVTSRGLLCRTIREAVQNSMEDLIDISADDVRGLDEFVSGMIDNAELDPGQIQRLDNAIREMIEETDFNDVVDIHKMTDKIVERVVEELVSRIGRS